MCMQVETAACGVGDNIVTACTKRVKKCYAVL